MGRKKIDIDWKVVDEKLSHFCEGTEVAAFLGISFDTLERHIRNTFNTDFADYKAQKRAKGEQILRELQLKSAMNGNIVMQIWLGKQYLGQTDKTDYTSGGKSITGFKVEITRDADKDKTERDIS